MNRRFGQAAVLLPTAGMEVCRLGVMAGLFFLVPGSGPPPFAGLSAALLASLLLTRFFRRIRRRRIAEVLASAAGCVVSLYFILRSSPALPFASADGLPGWTAALDRMNGVSAWYALWMIVIWGLVFWLRGYFIGAGPVSHPVTAARFDGGTGILFFVFFIRMGLGDPDPRGFPLTVAFFLFGIAALYAAKGLDRDAAFMKARSAAGLLVPFVAGFLLVGSALYALFPLLVVSAGEVYEAVRTGVAPLGPWIAAVLRFLFGFGFARPGAETRGPAGGGEAGIPEIREPGFWTRLIEKILAWGLFGVLGVLAVVFTGYLLWQLFLKLASRADGDGGLPTLREFLRRLLASLKETLRSLGAAARAFTRRFAGFRAAGRGGEGAEGFAALCRWGRLSGVGKRKAETPGEYGRRLARRFPAAEKDICLLVGLAEAEYYGMRDLPGDMREAARRSRRGLRSPSLRRARLASRLRPRL